MGSVAQWIAHWTSSEQWKKPFKGCGFESHQNRVLLRMLRYSVVPRPSAVPFPRPKKGFYSCTSYSEQTLPQMRPIALGRRLLLGGNPDCLLANAPSETAPALATH